MNNSEQTRSTGIVYKLLKIFTDIKPGESLIAFGAIFGRSGFPGLHLLCPQDREFCIGQCSLGFDLADSWLSDL